MPSEPGLRPDRLRNEGLRDIEELLPRSGSKDIERHRQQVIVGAVVVVKFHREPTSIGLLVVANGIRGPVRKSGSHRDRRAAEMLADTKVLCNVGRDEVTEDTQTVAGPPTSTTRMSGHVLLERVQHLLGGDIVLHGKSPLPSVNPRLTN